MLIRSSSSHSGRSRNMEKTAQAIENKAKIFF
jgi:hypothetical protein